MKYYYGTYEGSPDYEIESHIEEVEFIDEVAEAAAEEYYRDHDGWESAWPCDFWIFDSNKNFLAVCEVNMEFDPTFNAVIL